MDKGPRDQFDELIDSALASYGRVPACPGLEKRLLARVKTREARRPVTAWWFCLAAVAVACLLLWWPRLDPSRTKLRIDAITISSSSLRAEALPAVQLEWTSLKAPKRRRRIVRADPKLAIFPTITPLSGEERALARLVAEHPDQIPPELTDQNRPIRPIEITAVEIKPLP